MASTGNSVIEHDPTARLRGSLWVATIMLSVTALALFMDVPTLRPAALCMNAACWFLMAAGHRRDLKAVRLQPATLAVGNVTTSRLVSNPKEKPHTGMYRGGY